MPLRVYSSRVPPIKQTAPDPSELRDLVDKLEYRAFWQVDLVDDLDRGQGSGGLTLTVSIVTADSYHPEKKRGVIHYFIVPAASYDRRSWQRWLLDQLILVETHEACEFFTIDGVKPYAPAHGPGNDPYTIRELATDVDQRTSFRGEVKA